MVAKAQVALIVVLALIVVAGVAAWLLFSWWEKSYYQPSPEEYQQKLTEINERISKDPNNPELYKTRGQIYLKRNEPQGMALYLDPSGLSNEAFRNDLTLAEKDFEKALSLKPSSQEYELLLSNTKVGRLMRELKSVAVFADPGVLTGEQNPEVARQGLKQQTLKWTKLFAEEKEKLQETLHWLEVTLKHEPDWHLYRAYVGEVQFALGNKVQAYEALGQAIELARKEPINPDEGNQGVRYPKIVDYHYARAICHLFDGNTTAALEDMDRAVKLWPHYADVYVKRAFVYNSIGDTQRAIDDIQQAKRVRPGWSDQYDRMEAFFKQRQ